jgi:hypothetical protein
MYQRLTIFPTPALLHPLARSDILTDKRTARRDLLRVLEGIRCSQHLLNDCSEVESILRGQLLVHPCNSLADQRVASCRRIVLWPPRRLANSSLGFIVHSRSLSIALLPKSSCNDPDIDFDQAKVVFNRTYLCPRMVASSPKPLPVGYAVEHSVTV